LKTYTKLTYYNLQTFAHNPLINKLMSMQFNLFNIRPKLHHRKWRKLRFRLHCQQKKHAHIIFSMQF